MAEIVIYSKSWCGFCHQAKSLLTEKGQIWREIDVEEEPDKVSEMIERSERRTVPQIFIGEFHVGGFDDLANLERQGKLDELLARELAVEGRS